MKYYYPPGFGQVGSSNVIAFLPRYPKYEG